MTTKKAIRKSAKPAPKKRTSKAAGTKPVILITNDDGIMAPGIMNLVEAVKDLGKVVVVAPEDTKHPERLDLNLSDVVARRFSRELLKRYPQ